MAVSASRWRSSSDPGTGSGSGLGSAIAERAARAWPLPALVIWAAAWAVAWAAAAGAQALHAPGWAAWAALGAGTCTGALAAGVLARPWRRWVAAAGFPLSAALTGAAAALPAWAWLAALVLLALLYPRRAWRDAPFFPTPERALDGLEAIVVPPPTRVLDAGCGRGDGLRALGRLWPQAALAGIEWSRPLAALARWRCKGARVQRGDMWRADWSGHDLVYLFQRPESMARAWAKAEAELAPGAWLVSLEFEVPGHRPHACLHAADRRALWVYRVGAGG